MADLRRARVSVFGVYRGAGSERGRGENGGEQREGLAAHLIQARGGSGGRDDAGRRERPRGSLQREVGDEHFPNRPLAFSFSFYSSPFSNFFFCFLFKHTVIQLIKAPKHFQIL